MRRSIPQRDAGDRKPHRNHAGEVPKDMPGYFESQFNDVRRIGRSARNSQTIVDNFRQRVDKTVDLRKARLLAARDWAAFNEIATVVATPHGGPIRTIITGRAIRPTGLMASYKSPHEAPWEGRYSECPVMRASEMRPDVTWWLSQPFRLEWSVAGEKFVMIPDLARRVIDGGRMVTEIVEAKGDVEREVFGRQDYALKLAMAKMIYAHLGWRFVIEEPASWPRRRRETTDRLYAERRALVDAHDIVSARAFVKRSGGVAAYGDLASVLGGFNSEGLMAVGRRKIAALVLRRVVTLDFDMALWDGTEVRLVDRGLEPSSGHYGLFGEASS
jgi:hypothetical protein